MDQRKIYLTLSGIIGLILVYGLASFLYAVLPNRFYFSTFTLINFVPSLLGIAGIIIFISSQLKKSRLLRFFLCVKVMSIPGSAWYFIRYFLDRNDYYETAVIRSESYRFYIAFFLFTLISTCCVILLWKLQKEQRPRLTWVQYNHSQVGQFDPSGATARFGNRLIDGILILYLLFTEGLQQLGELGEIFGDGYFGLLMLEAAASIIYYLVLEGIFNTTAAKCVTGTTIVDENGQRPAFVQILTRTICRLIPF